MPKKSASFSYQEKAKKLKKEKLIKYDLRKKLTPQQKAAITRQWKRAGPLLNRETHAKRRVGRARAKELKRAGYPQLKNGAFYISKNGYSEIHVKKGKVVRKGPGKIATEKLAHPADLMRFLKERKNTPLAPGMAITVRIGGHAPFNRSFSSYALLHNYLNKFTPKDDPDVKDELIENMTIVEVFET